VNHPERGTSLKPGKLSARIAPTSDDGGLARRPRGASKLPIRSSSGGGSGPEVSSGRYEEG